MKQKSLFSTILFLFFGHMGMAKALDNIPVTTVEYQALVDFYNATDGDNWSNKWDISTNDLHIEGWYGVVTENGHITEINLRNNSVNGAIPASFGDLKYLKRLDLYGNYYNNNNLSTTDLNNLSDLERLEYLVLSYCRLSGSIPASWSKLTQLKRLDLDNNTMSGAIFEALGELKVLETINFNDNQFTAIPTSIGELSNLETLNLSNNQISGNLLKALEELTALTSINLRYNRLTGIDAFLPNSVALLVDYQNLILDNFTYTGTDVILDNIPEITTYNRSANDFSTRPDFQVYLRGSNVLTITMDEDGSLTIPAATLSSLKQGDEFYLRQSNGTARYTTINFETITIDLPAVPDEEYQALVDFYTAMDGSNWREQWPIETNNLNEGAWYGVSIENGHIIGISLRSNRVKGAIPTSFGDLKYLRWLDLYGRYGTTDLSTTDLNNLSGLESLTSLNLSWCSLSGSIPASWGNLSALKALNLEYNTLDGVLFEELGALKLLETLILNNNAFTGIPDSIGAASGLKNVNLSYNQISGSVPIALGNLTALTTLNLSYNQISGNLPNELEGLTALTSLNLRYNRLTGIDAFLPNSVSLLVDYQELLLDNFIYTGIDVVLANIPEITTYNRSANDFSTRPDFQVYLRGSNVMTITMAEDGSLTIPAATLSSLKQGDEFYLRQSNGTARYTTINFETITIDLPAVPDEEYQALVDFYTAMDGSNWREQWPVETNNLNEGAWYGVSVENGHIIGISLRSNRVKGAIPASFGSLKYLRWLDLYGRYGTTDLSTTDLNNLSGLESLTSLNLSWCSLSGSIPASWGNLSALKALNLEHNTLDGVLFEELGALKLLETLTLNNNALTGIPDTIGAASRLKTMNLSYNQISGGVPIALGNLTALTTLNLSYNQISGNLPNELEELTALTSLNLRYNRISGTEAFLPNSVSLLVDYQSLTLDNLTYTGTDVVLNTMPEITKYHRSANDFSSRPNFRLYLRGSNVLTITMAEDGSLTLPAAAIASLRQGDEIYLQQYSGTSRYSTINFETITIALQAIPDIEYQALVDFYAATDGENWNNQWPVDTNTINEGLWYGVSVENGHITGINLPSNRVKGAIPASFGNLKYLRTLNLYGRYGTTDLSTTDLNNLSGLERLEYVDLSYCSISGSLPDSWSQLTALKTLDIDRNALDNVDASFSVLTPESLNFQYQEVTLERIEVSGDNITVDLPRYMVLRLENNVLTYAASNEFRLYVNGVDKKTAFSNDGKLVFSDVSLLELKETDQVRIYQVNGIAAYSEINYDAVYFGLPLVAEEFEILKKIFEETDGENWTNTWDISNNTVNQIAWFGVSLSEGHVTGLDLFNNQLTGTIPDEITGLPYLETLNLSSNALSGALPNNVQALTNLEIFDVNSNQLSGVIPSEIAALTKLKKFAVGDNLFEGSIPAALSDFEALEHLDISSNSFDNIEKKLYYDFTRTYIDLRNQKIAYDVILSLSDNELKVTLSDIIKYDLENNNFEAKNNFSLLVNNLTHDTATLNDSGTLIFENVRIGEIPIDATIAIRQTTGSFLNTEFSFAGIEDKSRIPVLEEEYLALVDFQEQLNGASWTTTWDTTTNSMHMDKWHGVTTYDGHIVGIDLRDNNVSGTIPSVFDNLPYLDELDLSTNKITALEAPIPRAIDLRIDRQTNDRGALELTIDAILSDTNSNQYNHAQSDFFNQTYYLSIGSFSRTINMPEEGIKLIDFITNWRVPSGQEVTLRQNAGDAINSVITYELVFEDGDANLDGIPNVLDIQTTINHIFGTYIPYFNYYAADINADETINVLDLTAQVNAIQSSGRSIQKVTKKGQTPAQKKTTGNSAKLSISNGQLLLDPNGHEITSFEIILENTTQREVEEVLSDAGFSVFIKENQGVLSMIGFSLNKALSTSVVLANLSNNHATVAAALLANKTANEVPYEIIQGVLVNSTFENTNAYAGIKNFPNPFTQETVISFYSDQNRPEVTLSIFDLTGKKVAEQKIMTVLKGVNNYTFKRKNTLPSGTYFYTILLDHNAYTQGLKGKMIIN